MKINKKIRTFYDYEARKKIKVKKYPYKLSKELMKILSENGCEKLI